MNQLFEIFRTGAMCLANGTRDYCDVHRDHGMNENQWAIITSNELWTARDRLQVKAILTELINISMTISSIPYQPLPAQYVAAIICIVVSPCNRFVACGEAPDTFDGFAASGLLGNVEINPVDKRTLLSLVIAYSSKQYNEPYAFKVDKAAEDKSIDAVKTGKQAKSGK